jgi:hypothetical protein
MEASLSIVRLLQRSLMALSISILVFAISLRPGTNFDAANNELEALTAVSPDEFEDFAHITQAERSLLTHDQVVKIIEGSGGDGSLESDLNVDFLLDQFKYQQTTPIWVVGPRFYGALEELQTDLQSEYVWKLSADPEELRHALAKEIKKSHSLSSSSGGSFQFFALELRLARPDAKNINIQAVILPSSSIAASIGTVTLSFSINVHRTQILLPGLRKWFAEATRVGTADTNKPVFPALKPFWNKISKMKPLRAYGAISALRESTKKDITILGLTFGQDLAMLAAPVAIFFLTLYLFCHLSHVSRLACEAGENENQLRNFPWIGLFEERIARLISDASIIVLPLFANAVVIWKTRGSGSLFILVTVVLACLSVVCGLFAKSKIDNLRHLIEGSGSINTGDKRKENKATNTT